MRHRLPAFLGWLLVPAFAALALAIPVAVDLSQGSVQMQDACAQTGTCKSSPPDICFVNGVPYADREWISGTQE